MPMRRHVARAALTSLLLAAIPATAAAAASTDRPSASPHRAGASAAAVTRAEAASAALAGGAEYREPMRPATGGSPYGGLSLARAASDRPEQPRVRAFTTAPTTPRRDRTSTLRVRVAALADLARVRVDFVRRGTTRVVGRIDLGTVRTNRTQRRTWRPATLRLAAGQYTVRLHVTDEAGRHLARSAGATGRLSVQVRAVPATPVRTPAAPPAPAQAPTSPAPVVTAAPVPVATPAPAVSPPPAATDTTGVVPGGTFPVRGAFTFGGAEGRFGTGRVGHQHQGQDVPAAAGTPVVDPVAGTVWWRANQPSGAGYYVVVHADDGRYLVFMHLLADSWTVAKGDRVEAGQQLGQVGNTGTSSGPHLHFELWLGGWWTDGARPVDPLAQLQAWAAGR